MFFIGVFGIGPKEEEKNIEVEIEDCIQPVLIKRYQQFHFFFIPLFKWQEEYYIRCRSHKILKLKKESGSKCWTGECRNLTYWDYETIYEKKHCKHCGNEIDNTYEYCPKCGNKVNM